MSQSALSFADGGSALLRDPRSASVKQRRPYDRAKVALSSIAVDLVDIEDEDEQKKQWVTASAAHPELLDNLNDAMILCLVAEWSYGPVDVSTLENIPAVAYDTLVKACNKIAPQLSPDFSVSPDPKATTDAPVV